MGSGGIGLNIAEIQIQRQEDSAVCLAPFEEHRIVRASQLLIRDCVRLVARILKHRGVFRRQVFVNFELQALVSSGRSAGSSPANSAAYVRAASKSASFNVGELRKISSRRNPAATLSTLSETTPRVSRM